MTIKKDPQALVMSFHTYQIVLHFFILTEMISNPSAISCFVYRALNSPLNLFKIYFENKGEVWKGPKELQLELKKNMDQMKKKKFPVSSHFHSSFFPFSSPCGRL